MAKPISIDLSNDQALVLFELLSRRDEKIDSEQATDIIRRAEDLVLSDIHCLLERELAEPFHPDFDKLLEAARKRILGS